MSASIGRDAMLEEWRNRTDDRRSHVRATIIEATIRRSLYTWNVTPIEWHNILKIRLTLE